MQLGGFLESGEDVEVGGKSRSWNRGISTVLLLEEVRNERLVGTFGDVRAFA